MLPSQMAIDEMFDLDLALTMPEDSSRELDKNHQDAKSTAAAARNLVDGMPTVFMDGRQCAVCVEGFRSGENGTQVPCSHVFHRNCISQWLSIHDSCPLCRRKISGI